MSRCPTSRSRRGNEDRLTAVAQSALFRDRGVCAGPRRQLADRPEWCWQNHVAGSRIHSLARTLLSCRRAVCAVPTRFIALSDPCGNLPRHRVGAPAWLGTSRRSLGSSPRWYGSFHARPFVRSVSRGGFWPGKPIVDYRPQRRAPKLPGLGGVPRGTPIAEYLAPLAASAEAAQCPASNQRRRHGLRALGT